MILALKVRVLLVEDDEDLTNSWKNSIELRNADSADVEIIPTCARSYEEAIQSLDEKRFDAAVVDLRLKIQETGGQHNQQGNEVVAAAVKEAMPTVIYTGQPEEASSFAEAPKVRVIDKGEPFDHVLDWLINEAPLIKQMQNIQTAIRTDMATVFQSYVWPRWSNWMEDAGDATDLQQAMTRHFVSHMHAKLIHVSGQAHPEEWYFAPPVSSEKISTGDIFRFDDGKVEILVTPRCDMERVKPGDTIQLAECEDISAKWAGSAANKRKSIIKHNDGNPRCHFLPQMKGDDGNLTGPWLVKFDRIRSIEKTVDESEKLKGKRFAALTPEFLPSMVERLGIFFSRIGTPDHSEP